MVHWAHCTENMVLTWPSDYQHECHSLMDSNSNVGVTIWSKILGGVGVHDGEFQIKIHHLQNYSGHCL